MAALLAAASPFATLNGGAALAQPGVWRSGAPLEDGRAFLGAGAIGGELYVVGGKGVLGPQNKVDAYDVVADYWRPMPPLPTAVEQFAIASGGDAVYVAGGRHSDGKASREVWMLDGPSAVTWESLPSMPAARIGHAMAWIEGELFVVGGAGDSSVIALNTDQRAWRKVADMPHPRLILSAVAIGSDLYVLGGVDAENRLSDRVDILDTKTGRWRSGPALPAPRAGFAAAVLDGEIHVAGGRGDEATLARHDVLDPETGRWRSAAPLPTPRYAPASVVAAGRWFVIGGGSGIGFLTAFTASDAVEIYTP